MSNIKSWSTAAASNNSASPDGFPEGMAPSGVNDSARELMAAVRRWYEAPQWIDFGESPTYLTTVTFRLSGADYTGRYTSNRRIKAYGSTMGTLLGTIKSSTYAAGNTTVTVVNDSGTYNSTLAWVALSAMANEEELPPKVFSGSFGSASASATDAWNVTLNSVVGLLEKGAMFHAIAPAMNKGSVTVTLKGQSAKTIKRIGDENLMEGDIRSGQIFSCRYDGTNFQLMTPFSKPSFKDWGTFSTVSAAVDLADAEIHLVNFSTSTATATLGIISSLTSDKATVVVRSSNRPLVLAGVDNDSPNLTQSSTISGGYQDSVGFIKSFGKITAVAYNLNQPAT